MEEEIIKLQKFAERIAVDAGNIILSYKNRFIIKKNKDNLIDIATDADYASEQYILGAIKKQYPEYGIVTEETATATNSLAEFQWVIDPLDGTKEFIRNIPLYCVLIALEYKKELQVGVVYQPEIQRLYSASTQKKPTLNDAFLAVSTQTDLKKSLVQLRLPDSRMPDDLLQRYMDVFYRLTKAVYRLRSTIWDVESLCYVASGALEAYMLPSTKEWAPPQWWDVAPGILMVTQTGGTVTDFFGKPIINRDLTKGLIASNGKIHDSLLQLVSGFHS